MSNLAQRRHQWWVLAGIMLVFVGGSKGWSWWTQERAASTARELAKPGDITMYSTESCIYCAKAADWLDSHQVPWQECDVELNDVCRQTYESQGSPGTPLMHVKGQWRLGFDAQWLSQALQLAPIRPTTPNPP